jgi:hypothetical protein
MQKPVFKASIKHLFLQQFCFSSHTTLPLFSSPDICREPWLDLSCILPTQGDSASRRIALG